MIVLELCDVLSSDVVDVKIYAILFVWYRTYFLKGSNDCRSFIADVVAQKIDIQCGACCKLLVCIHQSAALQIEIATVSCLGHPIQKTLLKIACEDSLMKDILLLCNIQ